MKSQITNLYCPSCHKKFSHTVLINLCQCGLPLLVNYDLQQAKKTLTKDSLFKRINSMWRYNEVLPVLDSLNIVTLGEGMTPLQPSVTIGKKFGIEKLFFKDESMNPTGSFKARGLAMAVSKAKELGVEKIIIPTAGNAGSALAAYCARANIKCKVIMPESTPDAFAIDVLYHGGEVEKVSGSIKDAGARVHDLVDAENWFAVSTLKEPYRIEGKKTMGYELAEQLDFVLPDVIIYPTGGGTGLIGMWKAFDEMEQLGWIDSHRPKMVSVQSEGCAPIVKAFNDDADNAELWENPTTHAAGLRVPGAIGDFLILDAIRKSGGTALAVSEDAISDGTKDMSRLEGIFPAPEGGASLAAFYELVKSEFIKPSDTVVIFNTGSGYKYLDVLKERI